MTVKIDLSPEREAVVKARAKAEGVSAAQWLQRLIDERLDDRLENDSVQGPDRPLSSRIRELWADMPEDVRAEFPEGGAEQIDHHVYGSPKR